MSNQPEQNAWRPQKPRGQLIVYSGPSGVGKGTLLRPLVAEHRDIVMSVSATTRAPRPEERDGVDYHFVTREQFERFIADGEMLEYAEYNGNYYGTPRRFVSEQLDLGRNVVLEIEVKGAMQVKKTCPSAVLVFVMPPSYNELRERLINRHTESEEQIKKRLEVAVEEIRQFHEYDFVVINDNLEDARDRLLCAIRAGRLVTRFHENLIEEVLELC